MQEAPATLSHCELITDYGIKQLSMSPCAAEHLTVLVIGKTLAPSGRSHICCHFRGSNHLPNIKVHAYFAPVTPPMAGGGARPRYCRCCNII
ncbi:hypothetical protein HF086_013641 [Spodoptera exigua]|uniref:Uncharacterized protein n=1 Tax=Spodoptera exigua TaxID=7107 RepID=A0A922SD16_SPOEX|nr:hypothetical protein HF086_013641 [Spodoptera exigua]